MEIIFGDKIEVALSPMYQMPAFINPSIPRETAIVTILHSARLNMICGTHLERTATEKCGE